MSTKIRVAGIVQESIVDGPGIRYVVFAQGCKHNCPQCHNPETHSFEAGKMLEIETILNEIKTNPLLDGVTLSGGEPFEQAERFIELVKKVKQMNLNVLVYTGYTFEEIADKSMQKPEWRDLLGQADILVDGRFDEMKKDYQLRFRGSKNQRIIDLNKTRREGKLTLAEI